MCSCSHPAHPLPYLCCSGDGGLATAAMLNGPIGIAPDGLGGLYVCDYSNHAGVCTHLGGPPWRSQTRHDHGLAAVRYIFNGVISSVAGEPKENDHGLAAVTALLQCALDSFFIPSCNAGNGGVLGRFGDGSPATAPNVLLNKPITIVYQPGGGIYVRKQRAVTSPHLGSHESVLLVHAVLRAGQ